MKRKSMLLCAFIAILILCMSSCSQVLQVESADAYPWNSSEQSTISCSNDGDTVKFRYTMTYSNTSKYDISISHIVCSFDPDELEGWFGSQPDALSAHIQSGFVDNAEGRVIIPVGESCEITFIFEGIYLGGEVPDALSKPSNIIWGEQYVFPSQGS